MTWEKGQSGNPAGRVREGRDVACKNCGLPVYKTQGDLKSGRNLFCSKRCNYSSTDTREKISKAITGKVASEITREKLRQRPKGRFASNWKGGRPECKICKVQIDYKSIYCQKHKHISWTKEHWEKIHKATSITLSGKMPANIMRVGKFGNVKRGWFDINGKRLFFRSKWEANYALYLDFLIKQKEIRNWEYEKDVFIFNKIQFGTRSYRPDFKVVNKSGMIEYHEVKGWMTSRSKTQLKRMVKYYPNIKVVLIDKSFYRDMTNKLSRMIGFFR